MDHASNNPLSGGSFFAAQSLGPLLALAAVVALLVVDPALVIEVSTGDFIIVTVLLGGGAAWLSGQAVAETWRPYVQLLAYMLILAAAVRFIHYALFHGTLLSLPYYAVDFVILAAIASLGYRTTRARQMATQYGWLYVRRGPLGWSTVEDGETSATS
jgi:hypothetical protein